MRPVWIVFHLFMVIVYLFLGGIFIFTNYFPLVSGVARIVLGLVFIAYGSYRGYTVFHNNLRNR